MTETCPKCHCKRTGKYEYCICGHKWKQEIKDLFKDVFGVDIKDIKGSGK